jgi:hypothetical protein
MKTSVCAAYDRTNIPLFTGIPLSSGVSEESSERPMKYVNESIVSAKGPGVSVYREVYRYSLK